MSEIIDILSTNLLSGAEFTVNTALKSVDLTSVTGTTEKMLAAGLSGSAFTRGDNFIVLSAGFKLPDSFVMYQNAAGAGNESMVCMHLNAREVVSGVEIPLTPVGYGGLIKIPFANYETSLGVFVDIESLLVNENFYITCEFPYLVAGGGAPQVSMSNVPAALDGETFVATPFIKVLHNIVLF